MTFNKYDNIRGVRDTNPLINYIKNGGQVRNPNYNPKTKKGSILPSTVPAPVPDVTNSSAFKSLEAAVGKMWDNTDVGVSVDDYKNTIDKGNRLSPLDTDREREIQAAKNQSALTQFGNFLGRAIGSEIIGASLLGLSDIVFGGGKAAYKDITGQEDYDYSNPVSGVIEQGMDYINEKLKIHRENPDDDFDFSDFGYWTDNAVSVVSTLSMLIPTKAIGSVGKLMRFNKLGGKIAKMSATAAKRAGVVKNANKFAKTIEDVSNISKDAFIMRTIEGHREARDTYKQIYDDAINNLNTMSKEDKDKFYRNNPDFANLSNEEIAGRIATKGADKTFINDYWMLGMDFVQLKTIGNMWKGSTRAAANYKLNLLHENSIRSIAGQAAVKSSIKDRAKYHLLQGIENPTTSVFVSNVGEGFEELFQGIQQEKGKELGRNILHGTYNVRNIESYLSDTSILNQALWGFIGGVVFNYGANGFAKASEKIKNKFTDKNHLNDNLTFDKIRELDITKRASNLEELDTKLKKLANRESIVPKLDNSGNPIIGEDGKFIYDENISDIEVEEQKNKLINDYLEELVLNALDAGNADLLKQYMTDSRVNKVLKEKGVDVGSSFDVIRLIEEKEELYNKTVSDIYDSVDDANHNIVKMLARNRISIDNAVKQAYDMYRLYEDKVNDNVNNDINSEDAKKLYTNIIKSIVAQIKQINNEEARRFMSDEAVRESEDNVRKTYELLRDIYYEKTQDINYVENIDEFVDYIDNIEYAYDISEEYGEDFYKAAEHYLQYRALKNKQDNTKNDIAGEYKAIEEEILNRVTNKTNNILTKLQKLIEESEDPETTYNNILRNNVGEEYSDDITFLKIGYNNNFGKILFNFTNKVLQDRHKQKIAEKTGVVNGVVISEEESSAGVEKAYDEDNEVSVENDNETSSEEEHNDGSPSTGEEVNEQTNTLVDDEVNNSNKEVLHEQPADETKQNNNTAVNKKQEELATLNQAFAEPIEEPVEQPVDGVEERLINITNPNEFSNEQLKIMMIPISVVMFKYANHKDFVDDIVSSRTSSDINQKLKERVLAIIKNPDDYHTSKGGLLDDKNIEKIKEAKDAAAKKGLEFDGAYLNDGYNYSVMAAIGFVYRKMPDYGKEQSMEEDVANSMIATITNSPINYTYIENLLNEYTIIDSNGKEVVDLNKLIYEVFTRENISPLIAGEWFNKLKEYVMTDDKHSYINKTVVTGHNSGIKFIKYVKEEFKKFNDGLSHHHVKKTTPIINATIAERNGTISDEQKKKLADYREAIVRLNQGKAKLFYDNGIRKRGIYYSMPVKATWNVVEEKDGEQVTKTKVVEIGYLAVVTPTSVEDQKGRDSNINKGNNHATFSLRNDSGNKMVGVMDSTVTSTLNGYKSPLDGFYNYIIDSIFDYNESHVISAILRDIYENDINAGFSARSGQYIRPHYKSPNIKIKDGKIVVDGTNEFSLDELKAELKRLIDSKIIKPSHISSLTENGNIDGEVVVKMLSELYNKLYFDVNLAGSSHIMKISYENWKRAQWINYNNTFIMQKAFMANEPIAIEFATESDNTILLDDKVVDVTDSRLGYKSETNQVVMITEQGVVDEDGNISHNRAGFGVGNVGIVLTNRGGLPFASLLHGYKSVAGSEIGNALVEELSSIIKDFQSGTIEFKDVYERLNTLFKSDNNSVSVFNNAVISKYQEKTIVIQATINGKRKDLITVNKYTTKDSKDLGRKVKFNGKHKSGKDLVGIKFSDDNLSTLINQVVEDIYFNVPKAWFIKDTKKGNVGKNRKGKPTVTIGKKKFTYDSVLDYLLKNNAVTTRQTVDKTGNLFDSTDDNNKSFYIKIKGVEPVEESPVAKSINELVANAKKDADGNIITTPADVIDAVYENGDKSKKEFVKGLLFGDNPIAKKLMPDTIILDERKQANGIYGTYNKKTDTISLRLKTIMLSNNDALIINNTIRTILHESLHRVFNDPKNKLKGHKVFTKKRAKEFIETYEQFKEAVLNSNNDTLKSFVSAFEKIRAKSNDVTFAEEWVVESLTNSYLTKYLNDTIYNGDIAKNENKSLFQKIIDILLKLLGVELNNSSILAKQYSMLGEAIKPTRKRQTKKKSDSNNKTVEVKPIVEDVKKETTDVVEELIEERFNVEEEVTPAEQVDETENEVIEVEVIEQPIEEVVEEPIEQTPEVNETTETTETTDEQNEDDDYNALNDWANSMMEDKDVGGKTDESNEVGEIIEIDEDNLDELFGGNFGSTIGSIAGETYEEVIRDNYNDSSILSNGSGISQAQNMTEYLRSAPPEIRSDLALYLARDEVKYLCR